MNYNEIGVYEFFVKITYDEHFKLSDSEMYSYIKHKTDNFDFETYEHFRKEINKLSGIIRFIPPERFLNENKKEETTLLDFFEKHILRHAHENHIDKCKDLSHDELLSSIGDFDTKLGKYAYNFIDEYDAKMKMMEIQLNFKEHDFGFFDRYSQIIRFADILTTTYIRLFEQLPSSNKIPKLDIEKKPHPQKQPLTFPGLFNAEYLEKIDDLTILLRKNNIITETDELLLKGIDFARIFYYLIEINVIKKKFLSRNEGIKAFFARFKVNVVEKVDGTTSQVARSGITNNYAKSYDLISDDYILTELKKLFL